MRNPNRLDSLYNKLFRVHKDLVPDMRFGQFVSNFLSWWSGETKHDPWFEDDSEWEKHIEGFAKYLTNDTEKLNEIFEKKGEKRDV